VSEYPSLARYPVPSQNHLSKLVFDTSTVSVGQTPIFSINHPTCSHCSRRFRVGDGHGWLVSQRWVEHREKLAVTGVCGCSIVSIRTAKMEIRA